MKFTPIVRATQCGILVCLLWPATTIVAQPLDMDVPFITTPQSVSEAMLTIAGVGKQDFLIDLGSGDGRIVILAAKKYGARGLGVEIDPRLVEASRENAKLAGVAHRTKFRVQDLFRTDMSRASVITMYLLPDVNMALRPKLLTLRPGTRIVSHDWDLGDWPPDAELRVAAPEKKLGLDRTSRVMLWKVPALVEGRWCSVAHAALTLTLRQRYQQVEGEVNVRGDINVERAFTFMGRLDGMRLLADATGEAQIRNKQLVFASPSRLAGTWSRTNGLCRDTKRKE